MRAPRMVRNAHAALRGYRPGRVAHGALQGALWHGLRISSQILAIVIVAKVLGAAGYGALTGLMGSALVLGSLAGLGGSSLLLQGCTRAPDRFDHYWNASLRLLGQTASLLFPLYLATCLWLLPGTSPVTIAAFAVAELLCSPLILVCSAAFHARERLGWATAFAASISVFRLLAALTLWLLPAPTLETYGLLHLLASLLALSLSLALTRRQLQPRARLARYTRAELRQGLGFSLSTMTGFGYEETDKLIAVKLTSTGDTGAYTIAYRIARALALPVYTLMQAALPRLIQGLHQGQPAPLRRLLRLLLAATLAYCPAAIALLLVARELLRHMGPEFAPASAAMLALLPLIPLFSLRLLATAILTGAGRPDLKARYELLATVLLAAGCLGLIPAFGIPGAIMAVLAAETCLLVATGWTAWRLVMTACGDRN